MKVKIQISTNQLNKILTESKDLTIEEEFKIVKKFIDSNIIKLPEEVKKLEVQLDVNDMGNDWIHKNIVLKIFFNGELKLSNSKLDSIGDEIWKKIYDFTGVPVQLVFRYQ